MIRTFRWVLTLSQFKMAHDDEWPPSDKAIFCRLWFALPTHFQFPSGWGLLLRKRMFCFWSYKYYLSCCTVCVPLSEPSILGYEMSHEYAHVQFTIERMQFNWTYAIQLITDIVACAHATCLLAACPFLTHFKVESVAVNDFLIHITRRIFQYIVLF